MNKIIELSYAGISLKILPEIGGRIVSLCKNGSKNILKSDESLWDGKDKPELSAFSDFKAYNGFEVWLGPQNEWWLHQELNDTRKAEKSPWPPDPFLIYGEYKIESQTQNTIVMVGPESPITGMRLQKEIAINADGSIYIKVLGENISNKSQTWDLWFNTRMHGMNRAYVPTTNNDTKVTINQLGASTDMPFVVTDGFFSFVPTAPDGNFHDRSSKAFIYPSKNNIIGFTENYALQISFEYHKRNEIHPEQALVEMYNYTDNDENNSLLEMEYHSAVKTMNPGDTIEAWEVWNVLDYKGENTQQAHIQFLNNI